MKHSVAKPPIYRARHKKLKHIEVKSTTHGFEHRLGTGIRENATDPSLPGSTLCSAPAYYGILTFNNGKASLTTIKVTNQNYHLVFFDTDNTNSSGFTEATYLDSVQLRDSAWSDPGQVTFSPTEQQPFCQSFGCLQDYEFPDFSSVEHSPSSNDALYLESGYWVPPIHCQSGEMVCYSNHDLCNLGDPSLLFEPSLDLADFDLFPSFAQYNYSESQRHKDYPSDYSTLQIFGHYGVEQRVLF